MQPFPAVCYSKKLALGGVDNTTRNNREWHTIDRAILFRDVWQASDYQLIHTIDVLLACSHSFPTAIPVYDIMESSAVGDCIMYNAERERPTAQLVQVNET